MGLEGFSLVEHSGMQAAHVAELALFQGLERLLAERTRGHDADAAIDDLLAQLLAHTQAHFAEEERLMAIRPFPPAEAHAADHRQAIEVVRRAIDAWQTGRDPRALTDILLGAHLAWMRRHVATMDYLTAGFLVMAERLGR